MTGMQRLRELSTRDDALGRDARQIVEYAEILDPQNREDFLAVVVCILLEHGKTVKELMIHADEGRQP